MRKGCKKDNEFSIYGLQAAQEAMCGRTQHVDTGKNTMQASQNGA
jgi:hypothetical protein